MPDQKMQRRSLGYDEYFRGLVTVLQESDGPVEIVDGLFNEQERLYQLLRHCAPEIWEKKKYTIFKVLMALVGPFERDGKLDQKWQVNLRFFLEQNC